MAQDFAVARRNMVDGQLRPNQIVDPALLAALSSVPREAFVPADRAGIAYSDEAVPLGGGRALMEPMALARLIQIARPATGDAALVVGAGTGYGAAILSRLVATVVAVESDAALLARARAALAGAANVTLVEGALAEGGAAKGPYDLILVEGMIEAIPEALAAKLAEDGRLVAVVGDGRPGVPGQAHLGRRAGGVFSSRPVFDIGVPLLPGFAKPRAFAF